MIPAQPLITEHRLIERMIALMSKHLQNIKNVGTPDTKFIETASDFLRTYADRCHHGKEEDILFRDLGKKNMSAEHKKIMDELLHEHVMGRKNVGKLIDANKSYEKGNKEALKDIIANMEILVKFYPVHIEKEDNRFFLPVMDYFSAQEKDKMLEEFGGFDAKLIHERYMNIVAAIEKE